jgi:hypothetical protein
MKNLTSKFIIGTFVSLYLMVSIVSTIHMIDFFELSNPYWLAVTLAISFELGAGASLASLIVLEKMNKTLVWLLFAAITVMQMQGNMFHAFKNIDDFETWSQLFNIMEEDPLYQKRILSFVSGAILPLVALGFIKSLVDYIKPAAVVENPEIQNIVVEEKPQTEQVVQKVQVVQEVIEQPREIQTDTFVKEDEHTNVDDVSEFKDIEEEQNELSIDTIVKEEPKIEPVTTRDFETLINDIKESEHVPDLMEILEQANNEGLVKPKQSRRVVFGEDIRNKPSKKLTTEQENPTNIGSSVDRNGYIIRKKNKS